MQGQMMDNNSYNIIQALASSLEAIEAYRKYANDGNEQLWNQAASHVGQVVQLLQRELPRVAQGAGSGMSTGMGASSASMSGSGMSQGTQSGGYSQSGSSQSGGYNQQRDTGSSGGYNQDTNNMGRSTDRY